MFVAAKLDSFSVHEWYDDDDKDEPVKEKEEIHLCNVCQFEAKTKNELIFHKVCLVSIVELRTLGGLLGFSSELAKGNGLVLGASG